MKHLPYLLAGFASLLLAATSLAQRYKIIQDNGVSWYENAAGQKIFSLGVDVVDPGTSWNDYDLSNPSYAGFKYYPNRAAWATDAASRLQNWGFNTVGAWSDYATLLAVKDNHLYMTPILHMGSAAGAPWLDMWDPSVVNTMDDVAKDLITSLKGDPRIIGYFSDNELGWWKPALFKWIWDQKTLGTRRHTVALMAKQYGGSWAKMTAEFDVQGANSFSELARHGRLWMKPGAKGIGVISQVLQMLAHRYYQLCSSIIKKYDPGALYLGDRYISNYYPEVAEEAGKYCDVVTTNLNPDWNDGGFVRFHLDSLEKLTHKPLMVTEYYMTAKENRTGDKNDSSGFPVVQTQAERDRGFKNATLGIASYPFLVGAHWFQYYDEPQNGRGDGENYDFGLVDIYNKPYQGLVKTAQELDLSHAHERAAAPPISEGTPRAPATPFDMTTWDRVAAFVPAAQSIPLADLYCSWSPNVLDIAIYWHEDRFDDQYYKSGNIPDSDRTTIQVRIPQTNTRWEARMDDKTGHVIAGPDWHMEAMGGTASHLILQIPASAFGADKLSPDMTPHMDVTLVSESRAYTTRWSVDRPLYIKKI